MDVNANKVIAVSLSSTASIPIRESHVLPGLKITLVEEALKRSQIEDDRAICSWLLATFN